MKSKSDPANMITPSNVEIAPSTTGEKTCSTALCIRWFLSPVLVKNCWNKRANWGELSELKTLKRSATSVYETGFIPVKEPENVFPCSLAHVFSKLSSYLSVSTTLHYPWIAWKGQHTFWSGRVKSLLEKLHIPGVQKVGWIKTLNVTLSIIKQSSAIKAELIILHRTCTIDETDDRKINPSIDDNRCLVSESASIGIGQSMTNR